MRERMQKIDWSKFRIRSRKDWVIFWVFAVCICYAAGLQYSFRNEKWLFQFANPYMTNLNQPHVWGQLMGFLFFLAAVVEAVLFLCKKSAKAKILVLAGTLLVPVVLVAGYRIHTNLIVSSLWMEEPGGIGLQYSDTGAGQDASSQARNILRTEEQERKLLELCQTITPVSDNEMQEELMQWYREYGRDFARSHYSVSMHFRERYGHHYSFPLRICDGKVFLERGYSSSGQEVTFFEDNGIVEWLEEVRASDAP